MTYRTWLGVTATLMFAAIAGVTTSQQPPPAPTAATQVELPRSRVDEAELAQARQDPLAERLRGVLNQQPQTVEVLRTAQASDVPVLAPADPALLGTAQIYGGDGHYMMVVQRAGQIIEIYGATKALQSPVSKPPARPAAEPVAARRIDAKFAARRQARASELSDVRTERTEYGVDVAFNRFGAAYNVTFICEAQASPGCTEADAVAFAESLILIGGGA
ncbi:hypothetical protein [Brevundimonas lenta]|uniref:Uncharacterized protein n=1 Tax=Brevundimonas lenta TaxID=424796 RepID=A0A7W6JDG6_9CAUL|nr:hypothetical protein [Brevundimonas lenta]MBB4083036.1 hypothetical protein [Brevundimonas lenta]